MYEQQNSNHGLSLPSVIVGMAAGILGTIVYATYREKEFNRLISKSRELSDHSSQYLGDIGQNLKDKAVSATDSAENVISNLNKSVHRMAEKA